MTADERRETVLAVADRVFGERGFAATPTMAVADAAGISHAYLFRLFPTKSALTLAVVRHTNERLREAAQAGEQLGRDLLVMHLHSIVAAISDEAVRQEMLAAGPNPTLPETFAAVISPDRGCFHPTS
jgi:AcrR family transcriptional regulator